MQRDAKDPWLDETERDIVELLRRGWSDQEIALALDQTQKEVEKRMRVIFAKLNVRSRVELVIAATPRPGAA